MRNAKRLLFIGLAALGLAAVGCGGSSPPFSPNDSSGGGAGGGGGVTTQGSGGAGTTTGASSVGTSGGTGSTSSTFGDSTLVGPLAFPVTYAWIDASLADDATPPRYESVRWFEADFDQRGDGCGFQGNASTSGKHVLELELDAAADTMGIQPGAEFEVGPPGTGYTAQATWTETSPGARSFVAQSGTVVLDAFTVPPDGGMPTEISGLVSNLEFPGDAGLTGLSGPFDIAIDCR